MIKDRLYEYYIYQDYNCAESLLHAVNDEYNLGILEEAFKIVGGFGAGMGCGKTCGALCSGVSAIGQIKIIERAHVTRDLKECCAKYVEAFIKELGSDQCDTLVKIYKNQETRCLDTIFKAADILDSQLMKIIKEAE
ncbi:C-GCAxxG-C-C family protein [Irregularibacter muris]|uniref:C-GCAxxG-C-C family protein n=1 Tax=Irregularibacter muris TaxID=1796619 RepID=A0AAE3HK11_9FIRM|nr:C-GCAxxG-C-C family (seleno)protein [Irregularibacter muris]MCR1900173.1 C-GCAxxG-C-C family protein [Irregularibacter muris]